jgi:ubiquinol-cytochrome c reductase cytochrome c1 subunit
MKAAIDPKQAKEWFGANPPDLTLVARSRSGHGGSPVRTTCTPICAPTTRRHQATGWNNLAFPNVGMPHVLWELQGERVRCTKTKEEHGHEVEGVQGLGAESLPAP